jgi:hypothetical protein
MAVPLLILSVGIIASAAAAISQLARPKPTKITVVVSIGVVPSNEGKI